MLAFAALLVVAVTMAGVTAGSRARRGLGVAVGASALGTPWLAPDASALGRGALALAAVWIFARGVDLARDPRPGSIARRVGLTLAILDTRELSRTDPRFDGGAIMHATAYLLFGAFCLVGATLYADGLGGGLRWAVRWLAGLGFVYAFPEVVAATLRFGFGLVGLRVPRMHQFPIASISLAEFWGKRWNRIVGSWLRRNCFVPLARRRRAGLGFAFAFGVSTAIHAWFAGVAVGASGALLMGSYFVIQGVLVGLEAKVRPGPRAGRAWAILGAGLPAPLFVEPTLWIFEPLMQQLQPVWLGWA